VFCQGGCINIDLGLIAALQQPRCSAPAPLEVLTRAGFGSRSVRPMDQQQQRVFVIDDNVSILKSLERLLRASGFPVEVFTSPSAFLERPAFEGVACLLLDLRMPDLSGLDVQDALHQRGIAIPIVFLSGHADVRTAAQAMREGAVDFLVKPVDESQLLQAIARALARAADLQQRQRMERETAERLARLTKREREVCDLVERGLLNKQIAYELGTSEKTVKVHRGRVMRKLEVDSVAALVRLLEGGRPHRNPA
jgi:FixJ family two-component response regulator